jgi:hypothetical protein
MKRYAVLALLGVLAVAVPCQAQFLKKLEQDFLGGLGQSMAPQQQPTLIGNVNLPPGQYVVTNTQTGQAFYVFIQNQQMYLTGSQASPQMMPGQRGLQPNLMQPPSMGGFIQGGNWKDRVLRNELLGPQQQSPSLQDDQ